MSAFKEALNRDIQKVWFNTDEFGELHTIDGKEMPVLFDEDELLKRKHEGIKDSDGLYKNKILIFVPVASFGAKPKHGRMLNIDGKRTYKVVEATESGGVYALTLEANRI